MNRAKTYNKHVVSRSVGGGSVRKNEDGSPVLDECVKTNIRITPEMADTLNHGWDSVEKPLAFYYVEVKEEKKESIKSDARIALEAEATELGIKFRDNIGDEKLQQKINEAIEE